MPEFTAPGIGRESNRVTIRAELGENASGVLYALGGAGGGVTLYMDKGQLVYEYNMMIIERTIARSKEKLAAGKRHIEVDTTIAKPGAPADVVLKVDGKRLPTTRSSAPCQRPFLPAKPSMSALILALWSRSIISIGARSASMARSKRWRSSLNDRRVWEVSANYRHHWHELLVRSHWMARISGWVTGVEIALGPTRRALRLSRL